MIEFICHAWLSLRSETITATFYDEDEMKDWVVKHTIAGYVVAVQVIRA